MPVEGLRAIHENDHIAFNEYQNRFNALAECLNEAKARLDAVNMKICDKRNRQATIESFPDELKRLDVVTEFQPALWYSLADFMTIYSWGDVRVTFKDRTEIPCFKRKGDNN